MSTETTPQQAMRHWVNWRSAVLTGTCVAAGLMLNMMVLAVTPDSPPEQVQSAEQVQVASSALAPVEVAVPTEAVVTEPVADSVAPAEAAPVATDATVAPPATPVAEPAAPVAAGTGSAAEVQRPKTAASSSGPTTAAPTKVVPATVAPKQAAPTTAAPTTAAPKPTASTAAPTTAAPTTAAPTTAAPTTAAQVITYPSYNTTAGVIYLKLVDNNEISVYSVVGGDGWVYQIDKNGPRSVEVKFFNVNTQREAEFHAQFENGRIKVES